MPLPSIIYLKDPVIASWAINDGQEYFIEMEFQNANDQGKTPVGQGLFYCTDHAITKPNDHSPGTMGWLKTNKDTYQPTMNGFQLRAFLFLPLAEGVQPGILKIGPQLGQQRGGGNSFPDAAELSFSFQNQSGSSQMPDANNNSASQVNSKNVEVAMHDKNTVLFHEFTPRDGSGVLLSPKKSNPTFEKSVTIHLIDGDGNIQGILDERSAGDSFWCPIPSNNLYLIAALERKVVDGKKQNFNVGDPRTNGAITVDDDLPEPLSSNIVSWLRMLFKKIFG